MELPVLLAMSVRAVLDQIHERLAAEGFGDVRPAHGFAFQFLSWRDGATAVELAKHLGITKQAAVQLVDELEQRGYVERRPHPTDRRSRMVGLTRRGRDCIERFGRLAAEVEEHWAELVGPERLAQLRADLEVYVTDVSHERPVTLRPVW